MAIGFWAGTGSRDEPDELAGASHFLEHLLFKGTERRSAQEIAEEVEAVGGEMNAFTTKEYTAYYVRILDESLDLALDILSDVVWSPAFRPDEVDCERQVILEEIRMHEDTPDELVHSLFAEALFPGQTIGPGGAGRARRHRGHDAATRSPASTVTTTGPATSWWPRPATSTTTGWSRRVDRPLRRRASATGSPGPEAEIRAGRRGAGAAPGRPSRPTSCSACRGCPGRDPDRYALSVLNHVLGGGMSSRLFQEVREKRGLAYSVYSYRSAFEDTGMFAVYAGTAPDRAPEVLSHHRRRTRPAGGRSVAGRRRAGAGQGPLQGSDGPGPGGLLGPHGAARPLRADRGEVLDVDDWWRASTPSPPRTWPGSSTG